MKKAIEQYIPLQEGEVIESLHPKIEVMPTHKGDEDKAQLMEELLNYQWNQQYPKAKVIKRKLK